MPAVRTPRLTIGIPTYDRPQWLPIAIGSALAQSEPAVVLIADQTGKAAEVVRPYLGSNPYVRYVPTADRADCLWANWTAAVEACDTEFFCWLQDDDVVSPRLSARVAAAFDACPQASLYIARLGVSSLTGTANWWQTCGPMIPMDLLHGTPSVISPTLVTVGGFFASFALSPAVAFRWSLDAVEAARRCPKDADLYNERLVLAELGARSSVVCDPAIVGYWVQHEGNESKQQVRQGGRIEQFPRLADRLSALLESMPDWRDTLRGWCLMVGHNVLDAWLDEARDFEDVAARNAIYREALEIVRESRDQYGPLDPPRQPRRREAERATSRRVRRAERAVSR